ncbi:MAG: glycosyltransferase [Chromatiales bacterium]|nr:glycosyltransferase [Gammaproteobacteria bacterium]MCP5352157.1 glycosyltransferase [Chromatiales bacterium]
MRRLSIVAMAPDDWHGPWYNRQNILSRLAPHHDIAYTNGLWSVWDRGQPEWRAAPRFSSWEMADGVHLDHPSRWRLLWPKFPAWDRLLAHAQARRLRAELPAGQPLVAHIYYPRFELYLDALKPDFVIYHAFDRYSLFPSWTPRDDAAQRRIVARADMVIGTSLNTVEELGGYRDGPVRHLPNGVAVEGFEAVHAISDAGGNIEPDDIAAIPGPRIGYVGTLNPKVDLALLVELAARRPEWQFVFIGGVKQLDEDPRMRALREATNVHLLGPRPRQTVPAYSSAMDVNIIPYRVEEGLWSIAGDPLKLYESLAARTPIVACDLASLHGFTDVIEIAHGADGWEAALARALAGEGPGSTAARWQKALANSWDQRAQTLRGWLDEMVGSR